MGGYIRLAMLASLNSVAMLAAATDHGHKGAKKAGDKAEKDTNHGVDEKHTNAPVAKHDEAPRQEVPAGTASSEAATEKETKSIVPSKYAGKYKGGHAEGDKLGELIVKHSSVKVGDTDRTEFNFDRFFDLMHANGVDKAHIEPFRKQVADNALGAKGRARMTLRNRVESIVRNRGHFIDHEGNKHDVVVPARPATPRASKPKDAAEGAKESVAA